MSRLVDLTGKTFGKLTVVSLLPARAKNRQAQWRCRCSCGKWVPVVSGSNLRSGNTASCGCDSKDIASETGRRNKTHGLAGESGSHHYRRWGSIKQRTRNPNAHNYPNYGGRGISFHQPWADSFILFKTWLDENLGPCPEGYSLDRIDNNGNYEPSNLRWASAKAQSRNRRPKNWSKK